MVPEKASPKEGVDAEFVRFDARYGASSVMNRFTQQQELAAWANQPVQMLHQICGMHRAAATISAYRVPNSSSVLNSSSVSLGFTHARELYSRLATVRRIRDAASLVPRAVAFWRGPVMARSRLA